MNACQLELWLAQDRLRAAVDWADAMLAGDALGERPESEVAQLALARVLIVKGDAPSIERATDAARTPPAPGGGSGGSGRRPDRGAGAAGAGALATAGNRRPR